MMAGSRAVSLRTGTRTKVTGSIADRIGPTTRIKSRHPFLWMIIAETVLTKGFQGKAKDQFFNCGGSHCRGRVLNDVLPGDPDWLMFIQTNLNQEINLVVGRPLNEPSMS